MTVQADTIRQSMPRPKASVPKMETRQSTTQGNLSGTCKGERQIRIFKKGGNHMESKNFMTVDEVAQELNVSKSYAYKVVRELNAEMQKLGYLTVTGRVNTSFFRKKLCYSE